MHEIEKKNSKTDDQKKISKLKSKLKINQN